VVYETFGHVGLAIGMIIVGGGLFFYGYSIWKKTGGKLMVFRLLIVLFLFIFAFIIFLSSRPKPYNPSAEEIETAEENRLKGIDGMRKMDKPNFNNAEIDKFFSEYDVLYAKYQDNISTKNIEGIKQSQADEVAWVTRAAPLMSSLSTPEEKQQLALYIGKLSMQWQELK
jgi:hypothetical protein